MIYKKQYGHPFDTESVVGSFAPAMETIPYLTREPDGFSYAMDPQDILYGLGENIRGINKRGWVYESKCSDDPNHTENKSSLYGAYNFMIVSGKATFGFFIDYPGKVTFDCGYTDLDTLRVTGDHFSSRRIGWDVADATQNDPRIRSVSYDESLSARRPGLEAAGRRDCLSHHLLLPALRTILLPSALSSALSPGAGYSRTDRPHWAAGLPEKVLPIFPW